jgi:acetoin utilization protein AcuB
LVGIISILDMLVLFINLIGIIHTSSRLNIIMGKDPKNFEAVSKNIHVQDLNIISVGMPLYAKNTKNKSIFCLDLCETALLVKIIEKARFKVLKFIDLGICIAHFYCAPLLIQESISSALKHRCLLIP